MEKEALSPSVGPVGSCGSFFLKDAVRMITSLGKGNESQTGTRDNVVSPNARLSENDGAPYLPVTDENLLTIGKKLRLLQQPKARHSWPILLCCFYIKQV